MWRLSVCACERASFPVCVLGSSLVASSSVHKCVSVGLGSVWEYMCQKASVEASPSSASDCRCGVGDSSVFLNCEMFRLVFLFWVWCVPCTVFDALMCDLQNAQRMRASASSSICCLRGLVVLRWIGCAINTWPRTALHFTLNPVHIAISFEPKRCVLAQCHGDASVFLMIVET